MTLSISRKAFCWFGPLCVALALAKTASASCANDALAACFDADPLWAPAGPSQFLSIDSAKALAPNTLALGLTANFVSSPVALVAPAPDPDGSDISVLDDVLNATLSAGIGLMPQLEVHVSLPMVLWQSGDGASAAQSGEGSPVSSLTLRDPRLGIGVDLLQARTQTTQFTLKLSHRVSFPLGAKHSFAGERSLVNAPALEIVERLGVVSIASELGLRLRQPVRFADARLGSQFVGALGVSFAVLPHGQLDVSMEAWLLHTLVSQKLTLPNGRKHDASLNPAEWLLSARTHFWFRQQLSLQLGVGGALPLSARTQTSPAGAESKDYFSAPTSSELRGSLVVRYLL